MYYNFYRNTGQVRDKKNIVMGFDDIGSYLEPNPYFGCVIGRYANRIAKGKFTIDGIPHELSINDGSNHLHGGIKGFDKNCGACKKRSGKMMKLGWNFFT